MGRARTWVHAILLWLAFTLVLFPVSCGVFYLAARALGPRYATKAVHYPPPDEFPVLVVTPAGGGSQYTAQVVYFRNLEKFLKEHPQASFLVPEGWERKLNDQLVQSDRLEQRSNRQELDFDIPFTQSFTVERLGDGRQRLSVDAPIDDDEPNQGWYEASATGFTPQHHQHYITLGMSMGAAFVAVPPAAAFSIVLAVVLAWWVERKRLRKAHAAEAKSKAAGA